VRYEPPFPYITRDQYGERGHTVLLADFVTADDGTGIVHTAIAFGEDDFQLGTRYGLNVINPVRLDGTYDERIGKYAGRFVKDADKDLVEDLRTRGRLLRAEEYLHAYPHCWRSGDPLLYYAKPAWYIATSQVRDRLVAANETVEWHPEHIKHGRFGKWLENNVDWALSRERYWGTPLPIWRCEEGHIHCVGGFDELEELSGVRSRTRTARSSTTSASRARSAAGGWRASPRSSTCGSTRGDARSPSTTRRSRTRSSSRAASRPTSSARRSTRRAGGSTRSWRSRRCSSTSELQERRLPRPHPRREGKKMSKSLGNIVDPWSVLDEYGADAFRWYFFTSKQPWDGYQFSMSGWARACACSSSSSGTRTASTSSTRTSTASSPVAT
jgi:isoleucyl-tRNA synthetase